MGGDIKVTRELLRLHVSKYARDAAGFQARDFAMVARHHSLLEELPTTPLREQCAIFLAATIYTNMQRSGIGDDSQSPSRGAVLVAGKKHSSRARQMAAQAFRFVEVFCNS